MTADSQFWTDRRVFITGATGFLGSHLTDRLIALGAHVVILVRDDVPPTPIVDRWRGKVIECAGEVQDQSLLERIIGEYECSTVFHLAAQTQVGVANSNAPSTFDSNVRGTWSLLEACRRSPRVLQIVVASSDKAYGEQPKLPYTEDMPLRAVHPYDASKACADLISTSYAKTFDLPVTVARCGNLFGPGDTNWSRIIPGTIRSLLRGEQPIIRSDGTPTRDYLFVGDGAGAYMHLAQATATGRARPGEAFNFSIEAPQNALEVVESISARMGCHASPKVLGEASNEIQDQFLDSTKARTELGWSPDIAMSDALDVTIDWYKSYLAL